MILTQVPFVYMERAGYMTRTAASHQGAIKEPTASLLRTSETHPVRTHTDHRVSTPAGLTNTSSNSNLVFPGGLPSRYWPGSTLLSFRGELVLGCRVIWLWLFMPYLKSEYQTDFWTIMWLIKFKSEITGIYYILKYIQIENSSFKY